MRIDKYLKVARVIKRRVVGKELADHERLYLNDRLAKAASEVKVGDIIKIVFGHRTLTIKVTGLQEFAKKDDALTMYEVIEETKPNEL